MKIEPSSSDTYEEAVEIDRPLIDEIVRVQIVIMRILLTLIFYVLTSSLRAELLSATTTGRTINTGINQELLTKRATANAIENFCSTTGQN